MAKRVDNNGRKRPIIAKKLVALIPCKKSMGLLTLSKDALIKREEDTMTYKVHH
jgi:hypothetical protein